VTAAEHTTSRVTAPAPTLSDRYREAYSDKIRMGREMLLLERALATKEADLDRERKQKERYAALYKAALDRNIILRKQLRERPANG
jgi:hypothetical protein